MTSPKTSKSKDQSSGASAGSDDDALRPETEETTCVVIIGGGPAGIAAAITMKEDLGYEGFTIYEKSQEGVGGVWRANTYPGCGCDIPAHWYSFSRALNPDWGARYASQHEICAYWEALWARHGLRRHTRLGTEVVRATWDADAQHYTVLLEDVTSKAVRTVSAKVVLGATGGFQQPRIPEDLLGLETFLGDKWHSAVWRHDVSLAGKRVGVIGNGCSAVDLVVSSAQFVPQISADSSVEVINFCRTPQWYTERIQYDYPGWAKWAFAHVPFVMRAYRAYLMVKNDMNYSTFGQPDSHSAREGLTKYMTWKAPERYHSKIIPQFPPGCKRIIIDPGYLDCLHRPNVTLSYDTIKKVVPQGVQLETGEIIQLDVLILGTGFSLLPPRLEIFGTGGLRLLDYWESKDGPEAYYGIAVPNFPNYFMFLGPNTAGGHASVLFNEEVQIQHAMHLIKPILTGAVRSFAVGEEASSKYNSWLQKRLAGTVWNHCNSYYRRESAKGKIFATFPGPVSLFWWLARRPRYSDYEIVGGEGWQRAERQRGYILGGLKLIGITIVVGRVWEGLHH